MSELRVTQPSLGPRKSSVLVAAKMVTVVATERGIRRLVDINYSMCLRLIESITE